MTDQITYYAICDEGSSPDRSSSARAASPTSPV
jgi:hypothetical protein